MKLKVRTHPTEIYYVTGDDAENAHESAGDCESGNCFVTDMFGDDGWTWPTPEEFERDWADNPGREDESFEKFRSEQSNATNII